MSNYKATKTGAGQVLIPDLHYGEITDIYVAAAGGATTVVLYDGPDDSDAGKTLSTIKVASGASKEVTNCRIQFAQGGLYALCDANLESLTVHGIWTKRPVATVLSGG